jgi:prophage regulatory protein
MQELATQRLIRLREVMHLTGLGRSQTYALVAQRKFPAPIKISERCAAWPEAEVCAWIADRVAASRARKVAA